MNKRTVEDVEEEGPGDVVGGFSQPRLRIMDLVSILKETEAEELEPTDSPWGALIVGAGVLLAIATVGALFFVTAVGTKGPKSHGALKDNGGTSVEAADDRTTGTAAAGGRASTATTSRRGGVHRRGAKIDSGHGTRVSSATDTTGKPAERAKMDSVTESGGTGKGGTSTSTHAMGRGKVIDPKPVSRSPLVCVFGNRVDWKMHFPEDGLCDMVFYDSLYVHQGNTFQAGANFTADLRRWLAVVKAYNVTEPGIAVTSMSVEKARHDVSTAKGNATFHQLRASGVRHYGVLDFFPTNLTEPRYVQTVLRLFATLKKMHASHVPKGKSFEQYLALGVVYVKHTDKKVYTAIEKAASKGQIQLVILRTHLGSRDDAFGGDCRITGSTVWGKPVSEQHPSIASSRFMRISLLGESTLSYLRQRRSSFGESTWLLMSVSLAGRWYASQDGGSGKDAYAVGAKCKQFEFRTGPEELGSRISACTEQHYVAHVARDKQREVMSTYDGSAGLAFVFDSELTLYAKASAHSVCKARNALKDVRPIGLAVFDAELDDWSNTCKSWNKFGNYTLMRTARKTVDAIENATHVLLDCATLPK
ncbi:hypothetical protein HPB50_020910 [Hyalomma asiaticum]|uniref:Uncharacterized protein n=1 Tax=Hyalomma asiaticum TaxID=266040 RepID=A0ACB7SP20_HYAAI|nr:hypothetical protein HPB50_020910 [Hyalomma asiaticum]